MATNILLARSDRLRVVLPQVVHITHVKRWPSMAC